MKAGLRQGLLIAAAALVLLLPPLSAVPSRVSHAEAEVADMVTPRRADFAAHTPSVEARTVADWVVASQDNQRFPFIILDKREAQVFAFDSNGHIMDASPVLLGAAAGDDSVADIGKRPISMVRPDERTTPAGRFISEPGKNASGEGVVWVDYDAAVSMHRVRIVDPKERRLARLASPDPAERRISYGCINVPIAFFESVIWPTLGSRKGVIYVLPEIKHLHQVFPEAQALHQRITGTGNRT